MDGSAPSEILFIGRFFKCLECLKKKTEYLITFFIADVNLSLIIWKNNFNQLNILIFEEWKQIIFVEYYVIQRSSIQYGAYPPKRYINRSVLWSWGCQESAQILLVICTQVYIFINNLLTCQALKDPRVRAWK